MAGCDNHKLGGKYKVKCVNELGDWLGGVSGINGYTGVAVNSVQVVQAAALTENGLGDKKLGSHWSAGGA